MSGTNLKEFDTEGNRLKYNQMGFRDAVQMDSASPRQLIVRCVTISNRKTLDYLFTQMGITKSTDMHTVYSDAEWETYSHSGKYTYLICSMGNFRIIGSNGFSYSSGPIHKDEYIYRDKRNSSNALIVIDHVCDKMYNTKVPASVTKLKSGNFEESYIYHPGNKKNNVQLPVYNADTYRHELRCDICGNRYDEKDVHSFYSNEHGYVYKCKHCTEYRSPLKSLSYLEQLAKASGDDLDNYTFDGN